MQTYSRLPVTFQRGEGAWLWDDAGTQYLDAVAGVAVCGLGHAHPAITKAICEQAGTLTHTSNLFRIASQDALADRLAGLSGMERVFFCNSGAEANEAAIKIARRYAHERGVSKPGIIVMEGSFHGRTLATLSATGNRKVRAGFEPLVQGFNRVPYNDIDAVRKVAANDPGVVAVLVEPVLGEGGVVIPDPGYLPSLRQLCDDNGWLLMVDEIQTGMARTGRWFACQHESVLPDVMTLAKGLGNGFPLGACLARGAAAEVLQPGSHGSTFGGNPLGCRVGLTVIEALEQAGMPQRAQDTGARLLEGLRQGLGRLACIRELRGYGMMFGIELDRPCRELATAGLQHGIVINVTADNVVRLLPPLVLTDAEADEVVVRTVATIRDTYGD
jgi:acetylornithine aminotransferase